MALKDAVELTRPTDTPEEEVKRLRDVLDHLHDWTLLARDPSRYENIRWIIKACREPRKWTDPVPE